MAASMALQAEIMRTSHSIAKKHHRRWQRYVQAEIDAGRFEPRAKLPQHPNYYLAMAARDAFMKASAA